MTCCIIALALVYQVLAAWRWCKGVLGIRDRAPRAPRATGLIVANLVLGLRRPSVRFALIVVLALEGAAAGALVFDHRTHIGNELGAFVFEATGFGLALCRSGPQVAAP